MTDKVQKIREWVKARLDENNSKQSIPQFYGMMEEDARFLDFLDTMQEEPKHRFNVGDKVQSASGKIAKIESVDTDKYWCIGEQGMSIPFKYQDQWELVEEPEQCMYSKDNYTEEDRKVLCEGCEEKCEFNQVKESVILQHKEETCKEKGYSLTQEPASENLGEYINELSKQFPEVSFAKLSRIAVRVAKWQKEHLWKPADGDDLPEIDREVIVLIKYSVQRNIHAKEYLTYRIEFGHRPNPDGWDGTNIDTGEKEHSEPVIYDKGGWNQPHVLYWLDARLPYEEK